MKLQAMCLAATLALSGPAFAGRQDAELSLTQARSAVAAAERAGAMQTAPVDFGVARESLSRATYLFDEREWDDVPLAADKARADARVAEARSRQVKAEAALAEVEASIETLRAEIARNTGG
jgi:hypothetical protein